MTRRFVGIVLMAAGTLAVSVPAHAQIGTPRPRTGERPTRGLFGGGIGDTSQQLILNISFAQGYDDDLLSAPDAIGQPGTPVPARSGMFTGASGTLSYRVGTERVNFEMAGAAFARYYPSLEVNFSHAYSGQATLSVKLGSRTSLSMGQQVAAQPYNIWYLYGTRSPENAPDDLPFDLILTQESTNFTVANSSVSLEHEVVSRLKLTAGYTYFLTNFTKTENVSRYQAQGASGGIRYDIGKGLGARVNVGFNRGATDGDESIGYNGQVIDGGIDFNRALSVSRRSTLSFSTGFSGLSDQTGKMHYFFTGNAVYAYELGRSWTFAAAYLRTASLFHVLGEPVQMDTAELRVNGLLSRRLSTGLSLQGGKGNFVLAGAPGYVAGSATVGVRMALTRHLGVSANYAYYRYEFDEAVALRPEFSSRVRRQSVRISFDLFAPLVTTDRRANASR